MKINHSDRRRKRAFSSALTLGPPKPTKERLDIYDKVKKALKDLGVLRV